jgi:hypothetical protein
VVEYFWSARPEGKPALCSDDLCPCVQTEIPRGEGYLLVTPECVDFRRDARTEKESAEKWGQLCESSNRLWMMGPGIANPILMCEQGARRRAAMEGMSLEAARRDAQHWWQTGQVPLRPTPSTRPLQASAGPQRVAPSTAAPGAEADEAGRSAFAILFFGALMLIFGLEALRNNTGFEVDLAWWAWGVIALSALGLLAASPLLRWLVGGAEVGLVLGFLVHAFLDKPVDDKMWTYFVGGAVFGMLSGFFGWLKQYR